MVHYSVIVLSLSCLSCLSCHGLVFISSFCLVSFFRAALSLCARMYGTLTAMAVTEKLMTPYAISLRIRENGSVIVV